MNHLLCVLLVLVPVFTAVPLCTAQEPQATHDQASKAKKCVATAEPARGKASPGTLPETEIEKEEVLGRQQVVCWCQENFECGLTSE